MSRIPPAPPTEYLPLFGPDARFQEQVWAHSPRIGLLYTNFMRDLRRSTSLPSRLVELVRLRIAFHNQCRSCMSVRHHDGGDDGFNEGLVCSLERPEEAADLTEAERVVLAFADRMASDHLSVTDATFDELRLHFTDAQLVEICVQIGAFVGFGRINAVLDLVDDLSEEFKQREEQVTPWDTTPVLHSR
jgi:alkylhydroperoxidase family enzyme